MFFGKLVQMVFWNVASEMSMVSCVIHSHLYAFY